MEPTDEALLLAYRQGDHGAFAALLARRGPALLAYLQRLTGEHGQAEDLFQETFRRVIVNVHTFAPERPFKPWLYAIATNLVRDAQRQAGRRPLLVSLDAPAEMAAGDGETGVGITWAEQLAASGPSPAESAELTERRRLVHAAVADLPARQRECLLLAYFHGLTYPQIAAVLDCSVGTVKTHMSRALHHLAQRLPEVAPTTPGGAA